MAAGVELGLGTAVAEGADCAWSFFTGRVPFFIIRRACVTSKADSCCPTPDVPSQLPVYHLEPQVAPSAPPEHDLAAPTADASRYSVIVSLVNGAMMAVLAMNRAR